MAYLVLDLDLTAIASIEQLNMVHPFHTLSEKTFTGTATISNKTFEMEFKIINPSALAKLIETAYKKHDGVIILTSGSWDSSIRTILADNLELSPTTKQKLSECHFHSVETDKAYFNNLNCHQIGLLDKNIRLQKIIEKKPELSSKYFVALDDNSQHVNALRKHHKVLTTLATTDEHKNSFYNQTLYNLEIHKSFEPSKASSAFFTKPNHRKKCTLDALQPESFAQKKKMNNNASNNLEMPNTLAPSKARTGFFTKPNHIIIKRTRDDLQPGLIQPFVQNKKQKLNSNPTF
jgi:hypothetical protein